jgi:uncharacterized membrane protein
MKMLELISPADLAALALFGLCWIAYEPLLRRLTRGRASTINTHMAVVRAAWMRNMARREARFLDGQLLGHAITSATFFASSNLIVIAAAAGALFGGERALRSVQGAPLIAGAPQLLLKVKLALVVAVLGRSLLSFIWSIRQMNYCVAAIGAAPDASDPPERLRAYGEAAGEILNPALSTFNSGVRGYYFALAAGAWLLGPVPFAAITLGAVALLAWRQFSSRSAAGVRRLRALLEDGAGQP